MRNILAELYERTVYEQSRENPKHFPECFAKWANAEELGNALPGMRAQFLDCCEDLAWSADHESWSARASSADLPQGWSFCAGTWRRSGGISPRISGRGRRPRRE